MIATVISCHQRRDTRAETLHQLATLNIPVVVGLSFCCPPSRPGACERDVKTEAARLKRAGFTVLVTGGPNRRTGAAGNAIASHDVLTHALDLGESVLFCEDDITLGPDFPEFLELARDLPVPTYFYAHHTERRWSTWFDAATLESVRVALQRGSMPAGLHQLRSAKHLNNTQCVFLPREFLKRAPVHKLRSESVPVDIWLWHHLERSAQRPYMALPHPVQHRHVRVARSRDNNPNKTSRLYDLERG